MTLKSATQVCSFRMHCRGVLVAAVLAPCAWGSPYAQVGGQAVPEPSVTAPAVVKPPPALPRDVAFARFIALIRGHLLTGDELVGRRQWEAARPHFNFPTEEVYGIIRDELRIYKTPSFDHALKALSRAVKLHSAKQYSVARRRVESALAAADAALKSRQPNWPRFEVAVAIEVLKTATDEYDDAVANGRIVRPIGYQTARGFVLQADRMMESVASDLTGDNAAPLADIRAGLARLKQAFADVNAPRQAALDYRSVLAIVSAMELAAGKLP